MQELIDFLWELSMKDISKKADAYMEDKGIEIITCPDSITINDLYCEKDRSKIEHTNGEKNEDS